MDTLRNKTIHVESYGCTFNHADTEKIIALAERQGCVQVPAEEAECIIINTCTVVGATERTMLRRIRLMPERRLSSPGACPWCSGTFFWKLTPPACTSFCRRQCMPHARKWGR
ncbi:hypothetical protein [Methanogenium cariaci]|uniref:hypothetical protein n=1 Tax=Methanogenium cariaci TaxID=2197 RepID=UPI001FE16036|nr:hypothetical protein [Methanogenium cariaci]